MEALQKLKRLGRKSAGTDVWFGHMPEELPLKKLGVFSADIFASYSGPDVGLVLAHQLELNKLAQTTKGTGEDVEKDKREKQGSIAGAQRWNMKNRKAYGICMSLYDQHPVNGKISGDPIADSFGLCARSNSALLVVADGVNWGEKSKLAARCAVYGCMRYINQQLFEAADESIATTHNVFSLLLRSLDAAHEAILRHDGGLTTLCVALVCPLHPPAPSILRPSPSSTPPTRQFAVCVVNVGDSLAFVFSRRHGVREVTTGSHDIRAERDIRDAGGALGPVNGRDPELHNLTCSLTCVDAGDVVYLTTDGISDNFDPVVTKIAVARRHKGRGTGGSRKGGTAKGAGDVSNKQSGGLRDSAEKVGQNVKDNVAVGTGNEIKGSEIGGVDSAAECVERTVDDKTEAVNKNTENSAELQAAMSSNSAADSGDSKLGSDSNGSIVPANRSIDSSVVHATDGKAASEHTESAISVHANSSSDESKEIMSETIEYLAEKTSDKQKDTKTAAVENPQITAEKLKHDDVTERRLTPESEEEEEPSSSDGEVSPGESVDGKPVMAPHERHRYAVKEMERVLHEFELWTEAPCSAQETCGALLQHVLKLTDPKRQVLENPRLYGRRLKPVDRAKRDSDIVARLSRSAGKLDHATVIGYEVGCYEGDEDQDYVGEEGEEGCETGEEEEKEHEEEPSTEAIEVENIELNEDHFSN